MFKSRGIVLIFSNIDEDKIRALSEKIPNNVHFRKCKSGTAVIRSCEGGQFLDSKIEFSKYAENLKQKDPNLTYQIKMFAFMLEKESDILERW